MHVKKDMKQSTLIHMGEYFIWQFQIHRALVSWNTIKTTHWMRAVVFDNLEWTLECQLLALSPYKINNN